MMMVMMEEQTLVLARDGDAGVANPNPAACSTQSDPIPSTTAPLCSPSSTTTTVTTPGSGPSSPEQRGNATSAPAHTNNPSHSQTAAAEASAQDEQLNRISLTLSAEEEDSQLKSPESSNDDEPDDRPTNTLPWSSPQKRTSSSSSTSSNGPLSPSLPDLERTTDGGCRNLPSGDHNTELRFLVRRREAGALIGKRGSNIKRLRETFRGSMFNIPDTGNGPERVVCVATNEKSMQSILNELTQLLVEKSPENDEQIELKLLIHSSQAGSIIGIGGQSIKKLRNDSRAAIKIYELCCPFSNERVCAIKARPPVVVNTIKLIQTILNENPIKGTIKPYDALHFDLLLAEKYGGFLPDDGLDPGNHHHPQNRHYQGRTPLAISYARQYHEAANHPAKHHPSWGAPTDFRDPYDHQHLIELNEGIACHLELQHHHAMQQSIAVAQLQQPPSQMGESSSMPSSTTSSQQLHQYHEQQQLHQRVTNHDPPPSMDCENGLTGPPVPGSKSSCPPSAFGSSRPIRQAFRYHPYAQQIPGLQASYAACVRPTLRHHHQQQQYPLAGATRFLYGPHNHHNHRNQCNRMPALFEGGSPQTVRCRHLKPCFCLFMPIMPFAGPQSTIPQQAAQSAQASMAQLGVHLAKSFGTHPTRSPAVSGYQTNNNNIDSNSKQP